MSNKIEDLEPVTRKLCEAFLDDVKNAGYDIRVTQTLRTMDEQTALYAKGRALPGPIVTHAMAGQSAHNWGCAFDICFGGPEPFSETHSWSEVGHLGRMVGLVWGGEFHSIPDKPHFERPDWRNVREAA